MSESLAPQVEPQPVKEKIPPFVQVIKTPDSCQVNHNLIDPWLAMALLEMGKQALLEGMKSKLVKPTNGMAGIMAKMGRS